MTTVTPFSKLLAMTLLVVLPFVGFELGMRYQRSLFEPQADDEEKTEIEPGYNSPVAGVCQVWGEGAEIVEINRDNTTTPRCIKISGKRGLGIRNNSLSTKTFKLGKYSIIVKNGQFGKFEGQLGDFLGPGVHQMINGPEVWIIE